MQYDRNFVIMNGGQRRRIPQTVARLILICMLNIKLALSQQLNLPLATSNLDDCDQNDPFMSVNQFRMLGNSPSHFPSSRQVHCVGGGYFVGMRIVYTGQGSLQVAQLHCASGNVNVEGVGRMQYPSLFKFSVRGEEQDFFCPYGYGVSGFGGTVDGRGLIVGMIIECTNMLDQYDITNTTIGHIQATDQPLDSCNQMDVYSDDNKNAISLVKSFNISFELNLMGYQSYDNWMFSIGMASCMRVYDLEEKAPQLVQQCDDECLNSADYPYAACQWERQALDRLVPSDCSHSILGCECDTEDWVDEYGMKRKGGCIRLNEAGISRCPILPATCPRDAMLYDTVTAHGRLFDFCQQSCNEMIKPIDEILFDPYDLQHYHSMCDEDVEISENWVQLHIGYTVQNNDGRSGWYPIRTTSDTDLEPGDMSDSELCLTVKVVSHLGGQPQVTVDKCIDDKSDPSYRSTLFRKVTIYQFGNEPFEVVETALFPGLCVFPSGLGKCSEGQSGFLWYDSTHVMHGCWSLYIRSTDVASSGRLGGARQPMSVVPLDSSSGVSSSGRGQIVTEETMINMCELLTEQSSEALGYVDGTSLSIALQQVGQESTSHEVEVKEVLNDSILNSYNTCDHKPSTIPPYCEQDNIVCDHLGRVVYLAKGQPTPNLLQLSRLRAVTLAHKDLIGHFPQFTPPSHTHSNLSVFILQGNQLTGTLPDNWAFALSNLKLLDIAQDVMFGELPRSWSWESAFSPSIKIKLDYQYLCQPPLENATLRFVDLQEIPKCECQIEPTEVIQYKYKISLKLIYPQNYVQTPYDYDVSPEVEAGEVEGDLEGEKQCAKAVDCESLMCEEVRWMQKWRDIEELACVNEEKCSGGMNPFWMGCVTESNISKIVDQVGNLPGNSRILFGDINTLDSRKNRKLLQENQLYMLESTAGLLSFRADLEEQHGLDQLADVVVSWFKNNADEFRSAVGLLQVELLQQIVLTTEDQNNNINEENGRGQSVTIVAAVGAALVAILLLGVVYIVFRKRKVSSLPKSKSTSTPSDSSPGGRSFRNRSGNNNYNNSNNIANTEINRDLYMPNTIHFFSEDQNIFGYNIETPRRPDIDFNISYEHHLELSRQLAQDEFGVTYQGRWRDKQESSLDVTVKVINPIKFKFKCKDTDFVALIREELKSTCQVSHPCLVQYYGGSFKAHRIAIVSEYMDGWTLEQYIHEEGNRLSARQILQILRSVSRALTYLHPTIVHQAIQPANILLSRQGVVKVTEYGLSNIRNTLANCAGVPFATATAYEAPEMLRNSSHEQVALEKVDIYALGILVWEMCTSQKPCSELESRLQLLLKIGYEKYRPPLPRDCAPALLDIMTQCWHEDPKLRPSAAEIYRQADIILRTQPDSLTLRIPSPLYNFNSLPVPYTPHVQTPEQSPDMRSGEDDDDGNRFNQIEENDCVEQDQQQQQDDQLNMSVTGSTSDIRVRRVRGSYREFDQHQKRESPPYWRQVHQQLQSQQQQNEDEVCDEQSIAVFNYFTGLDGSSLGENSVNIPQNKEIGDMSSNRKYLSQVELLDLGRLRNRDYSEQQN